MSEIVNRVAQSGIVTFDLESLFPKDEIISLDLKKILYMEMILREQDLRDYLRNIPETDFKGKYAAVHCSADIIIPQWTFMLIASRLSGLCKEVCWGSTEEVESMLLLRNIQMLDTSAYAGKRIMVKGCSNKVVPPQAFMDLVKKLQPVVQSLMYGEACSAVPVYKKPRTGNQSPGE